MHKNGTLYNYLGSDENGWGYIANKAIWHNKGRIRYYGDVFRENDRIGVTLNMDNGTLSFSRNGIDLGVAVEGLSGDLYPAFSLYNENDQISLKPENFTSSKGISGGYLTSLKLSKVLNCGKLLNCLLKGEALPIDMKNV